MEEAVALVLVRGNRALERQREESRFLLRPRTQTGRAADALGWEWGREREKETQDYSWASGLSDTGVTKGAHTEIRMAAVMRREQLGLKCPKTEFEEPQLEASVRQQIRDANCLCGFPLWSRRPKMRERRHWKSQACTRCPRKRFWESGEERPAEERRGGGQWGWRGVQ